MRATFNCECDHCEKLKPRCARVQLGARAYPGLGGWSWIILCESCRQKAKPYTIHPDHKPQHKVTR